MTKQKKEIKILFVLCHEFPSLIKYADRKRVESFIYGLAALNYQIHVICPQLKNECQVKNHKGITIHSMPSNNIRFLRRINYGRLLKEKGVAISEAIAPDIIFVNNPLTASYIQTIKKRFNFKIYWDVMGINHIEKLREKKSIFNQIVAAYYEKNEKIMAITSDKIITVNYAHKEKIREIFNKTSTVIRDAADFQKKKNRKVKNKKILIIFVGSLIYDRLNDLITAVPKLPDGCEIIVLGDGPDKKIYLSKTQKHRNKIKFLGYVDPKKALIHMSKADIGYSDDWSIIGFPIKVFEYMSVGLPIIIQDTAAVREIIKNGRNGLTYADKAGLLEKILVLIHNEKIRNKLGINARRDMIENHLWEKRVLQLSEMIKNEKID